MKKILMTAVAGLSLVAAPLAATAAPYHGSHGFSGDYRRGDNGRDNGAGVAIAAGVFGLILGAALANSADNHQAYEQRGDYGRYQQADYGYQGADYGQRCAWVAHPYTNGWGQTQYQEVWTCR
ncbi:MAG TPA: hypothetical protein VKU90_00490 [Caulobacteraceae bacterium]|nr:hypothetical protein [Caulobacteraceae bacterium]